MQLLTVQIENLSILQHFFIFFKFLNEFSLRDIMYKSLKTSVYVDNEKLEDFVGTGIVFSTLTGSTALNLSIGGAIIYQNLEAIQMTPREAITNSKIHALNKSICIPKETIIFLDEIQDCPKARTALKFLSMDDRFDVVASG